MRVESKTVLWSGIKPIQRCLHFMVHVKRNPTQHLTHKHDETFASFSQGDRSEEHFGKFSSILKLVSQGCQNKLPQIAWLKTTELYFLTVLKARSPKPRCWQGHTPSESFRGESVPSLLQLLVALTFLGLWQYHSCPCLCLHMAFFSVSLCVSFSVSYTKTLTGFRAHAKPM